MSKFLAPSSQYFCLEDENSDGPNNSVPLLRHQFFQRGPSRISPVIWRQTRLSKVTTRQNQSR